MVRRRFPPWLKAAASLPLAGLLLGSPASAGGDLEWGLKATYLYKFFAFVDWPPGALGPAGAPAALCVVGEDPFGPLIDEQGQGQRIGEHPIEVRRMRTAVRGSGCRVLYFRKAAGQSAAQAMAAVAGEPVLTVTDGAGVQGVIQFRRVGDKIRFDVDQRAAAANGLTLSSRLLSVAVKVR